MTGTEYEQFVRAVLVRRLGLQPDRLQSARATGVSFPGGEEVKHQIDLFFTEEGEVADYLTIIECKYRESSKVDQEEVGKLAFVKSSLRASKAILVTNKGFTSGACAVATAEKIALLVVEPQVAIHEDVASGSVDELFAAAQAALDRADSHKMTVVCRAFPDPNDRGTDLIAGLLSDPAIRAQAERLVNDPGVREQVADIARRNPDLARQAMNFFKKGGW